LFAGCVMPATSPSPFLTCRERKSRGQRHVPRLGRLSSFISPNPPPTTACQEGTDQIEGRNKKNAKPSRPRHTAPNAASMVTTYWAPTAHSLIHCWSFCAKMKLAAEKGRKVSNQAIGIVTPPSMSLGSSPTGTKPFSPAHWRTPRTPSPS